MGVEKGHLMLVRVHEQPRRHYFVEEFLGERLDKGLDKREEEGHRSEGRKVRGDLFPLEGRDGDTEPVG